MLGYPGAGKTTTAKVIAQLTGAVHLSSDHVRTELFAKPSFSQEEHQKLYQELDAKTEELLGGGKSVIYDANLNRYQHRKDKYNICAKTGSKPVLIWVKTPRDLAKSRALHDSRSHLVPKDESADTMFERIANIIEPPKADEIPVIVDGTRVTKDYISKLI